MKKTTLALSTLAAVCSGAWAQSTPSTVTVYGVADAGIQTVSGMRGGTTKQLISGMMDGSRLGFKGNEDIGGGYRAIFTLENRLELDTGATYNRPPAGSELPARYTTASLMGLTGLQAAVDAVVNGVPGSPGLASQVGVNVQPTAGANFFDRQAYVGLVTPVGAIIAGRQYTPAYEMNFMFDTLKTQSALSTGQVAAIPAAVDIRISNALQYRIETSGFTASLMYGFGETGTSDDNRSFMGGMVMYKNDTFSTGIGYNTRNNELGYKSLTSTTMGASVNVGPGAASVLFGIVKDDHPTSLSTIATSLTPTIGSTLANQVQNGFIEAFKQDAQIYHGGYRFDLGVNTIYVAYNLYDDKRPNNADTQSYGIVYSYSLSKRTDINTALVQFDNKGLGQAAPGGAGYLGGATSEPGRDSTSFALGLRHRF